MVSKTPLTSQQQLNLFRLRDKMSLLNSEFLHVLQNFYKEKSHYDFTLTMRSYMDHVKELKIMYDSPDAEEFVKENGVQKQTIIDKKDPVKNIEVKAIESRETVIPKPATGRVIATARRRNTPKETPDPKPTKSVDPVLSKTPFPTIASTKSSVFASSSPAVSAIGPPRFGDISVIEKITTPAPAAPEVLIYQENVQKASEPAQPAARKRAIRGGGPLGGSESVVFKGGNGAASADATTSSGAAIPLPTIKFPAVPTKDFWNPKKSDDKNGDAPNGGGSLFAFLGSDKNVSPAKFTGFSFGKKNDDEKGKEKNNDEKETENSTDASSVFKLGSTSTSSTESPSTITNDEKKEETTKKSGLSFPSFAPVSNSSKPALSFPAFGGAAPMFGSSTTPATSTSAAPTLSFPTTGGSLFGNLAQKASENVTNGENEEEGEYVPPKVEVVENEEPDAILSSRCAIFKFSGKEYTKLGVGMVHVKETDGKSSVLIRAATSTGTVWLNALCSASMKATKADAKGEKVRLTCPVSASEMATMLIRFGTAAAAVKFIEEVEEKSK